MGFSVFSSYLKGNFQLIENVDTLFGIVFNIFEVVCIADSGPVHTYPFLFENYGDFFPSVFKKIRVHTKRIRIVLARPYENTKQWKYDSTPQRVCIMLVVCITSSYSKTSVFIRPNVNEWPAFSKIFTVESVFERMRFR